MEKSWRSFGQQVILLINENCYKNYRTLILPNIGRLNLYIKRSTKCEVVAKIQDAHVAKLWGSDHV